MGDLFIIIFLLSILGLFIGLIKPSIIKISSRKKVLKIFIPTAISSFVLLGFFLEPVDESTSTDPQIESEQKEKNHTDEQNNENSNQKDKNENGSSTDKKNDENVDNKESEKESKRKSNSNDVDTSKNDNSASEKDKQEENSLTNNTSLSDLTVHYIDAGQADATLFEYEHENEDYYILLDSGDWNSSRVLNYLNHENASDIDLLIGTHNHADHIGQMDRVIQQFNVDEVWLNGNTATSKTFERAINAIENNDVSYHEPRAGEEYEIGSLEIDVLHPKVLSGHSNDDSISTKFTYGDTTFFFSGDTEASGEAKMVNRGGISADILQLGHHGSKTSNSSTFLEAVDPEVAIYSAGSGNSYGHPHSEVVNRIKSAGIDLYGTDVHGTIIITTNGSNYSISTNQNGNISPSSNKNESDSKTNQQSTDNKETTNKDVASDCIDINSATSKKLQKIIHIGPERAEALISLRPFNSVSALDRIKGIGPSRVEDIKTEGIVCTSK